MSSSGSDFERLMERARTGDPEVGKEIFERYGKAIQMVVRYHLDRRLRSQYDSLDFTQDAWASFFRIPTDNYTFRTPEELMAFLSRVVRHKIIDAYRKRCRRSQEGERKFVKSVSYDEERPARQPTASQVAIVQEEWRRLLKDKSAEMQRALEMVREGYSQREIAQTLGLPVKSLQRLIKQLNERRRSP